MSALYGDLHALSEAPRGLQLAPQAGFGFARQVTEVPIHGFELTTMVAALPLALQPGDPARPMVGITGQVPGENVCIGPKGGWPGVATPAALESYPFVAAPAPDKDDKGRLYADFAGDLLVYKDGLPLFDGEGEPTETLVGYRDAAIRQYRDRRQVARAVAALHEAGVLAPYEPNEDVETVDPERHCYVSTQALAKVDDETFVKLRRLGAIAIAFGQAHSLVNMRKIRRMHQQRQRRKQARPANRALQSVQPLDDEELVFGEETVLDFS